MIFKLILDMQGLIGMRIDPRDLVSLFKSQKKNPDKLFKYSKVQVSILRQISWRVISKFSCFGSGIQGGYK
jgi:hypothetical protein